MNKTYTHAMLSAMAVFSIACATGANMKAESKNALISSQKVSGLQARLIAVCFSDFQKACEAPGNSLDYSKFEVTFNEDEKTYFIDFLFSNDGSDRTGGRSKWGRDVRYEVSKSKFDIIGRKYFK